MTDLPLGPDLVDQVHDVVYRHTRRTPLVRSEWLSSLTGAQVYLKLENQQVTGSFKVRGAVAALSLLAEDTLREGVVTASAGNHGLGLAHAASIFHAPCTVVVSSGAPRVKVEGMEALGAAVVHSPHEGYDDTEAWVLERAPTWGRMFISPYDHPAVAGGNGGTLALEILDELPDPDVIVVPCGGGGLSAGVGMLVAARGLSTRVIGVNTDASPGMWLSRRDGRAHLRVRSRPTIAEGIEGGVSERSFAWSQQWVHDVAVVKEATIHRAVGETLHHERLVIEGSAAAGPALLLEKHPVEGKVVVVLTGGNIDAERLGLLTQGVCIPGGSGPMGYNQGAVLDRFPDRFTVETVMSLMLRRAFRLLLLLPLVAVLASCSDDETTPQEILTVNLQVAPGHIHAFESNVALTVTVTNDAGTLVQDFTTLRVEFGPAGTENWTKNVPVTLAGTSYTGTTKMTAAGSFDVRVVGQRPGQGSVAELFRRATPIASARPHFDGGGYRVEFETNTGEYPVAGEPVTLRFLIMEDVAAPRPAVGGLTGVLIRCTEGDDVAVHNAGETPAGTYSATHTFETPGDVTAEIEFTGSDGQPAVVTVPLIAFLASVGIS